MIRGQVQCRPSILCLWGNGIIMMTMYNAHIQCMQVHVHAFYIEYMYMSVDAGVVMHIHVVTILL